MTAGVAVIGGDGPCPWCAVWIGRHGHLLRDDGTLGVVVLHGDELRRYLESEG